MSIPLQPKVGTLLPPGKIQGRHLDRLAIVYVRQSTLQQLEHHRESTSLQYGLAERAYRLGWPHPRVTVIDDDLGCSGASAEGRPGFQRLVAEVGLGHVGLVLGFEVSRLARSCRDWYHLLEICALAETLIADSDGVYDPALYNDRLLLGLKGTMSEAELHIMRARLDQGRRHKAERGELGFNLARGYLKRPSGEVTLDPDERVRDTIRIIFDVFARRRSVLGVVRYLVAHSIGLPDRIRNGPGKGDVVWRTPHRSGVLNIISNPIYAGAYVYGRRHTDALVAGTSRRRAVALRRRPDGWQVLLKDRWPAYISWAVYEENQKQLAANQSKHTGVARGGPSLLSGLLVCGRCGHRMATGYRTNGRDLRYACTRPHVERGEAACQSLSGGMLDALIADLVLAVLQPSAIEISVQLAEDVELERAQRHRQWALRLEQARFEVERAERQYNAVEPENRLVARTLEKRWEDALAAETKLQDEHARFLAREPARLTASEHEAIRRLAEDVPALWHAATTKPAERKEIVRLLLERVVVTIEGSSENLTVECHWAGGSQTQHQIVRPVRGLAQLSRHRELVARIKALHDDGARPPAIARALNSEGWRRPRGGPFTKGGVRSTLHRMGILPNGLDRPSAVADRAEGECTVAELSAKMRLPEGTIYSWLHKGWLPARRIMAANHALWLARQEDAMRLQRQRTVEGQRRTPYTAPRPLASP